MRWVVPAGAVLGEGALWDAAEQALYWVDIKGRRVHPLRSAARSLSGVVGAGRRRLVRRARRWRPGAGAALGLSLLRSADGPHEACRRAGARARRESLQRRQDRSSGTLPGREHAQSRDAADGRPLPARRRPLLPAPDRRHRGLQRALLESRRADDVPHRHADTHRVRLGLHPASGDIANRRTFVRVPDGEGYPDGATVDADGFVWIAHWDAGASRATIPPAAWGASSICRCSARRVRVSSSCERAALYTGFRSAARRSPMAHLSWSMTFW